MSTKEDMPAAVELVEPPTAVQIQVAMKRAWTMGCERHDPRPGAELYAEAMQDLYRPLIHERDRLARQFEKLAGELEIRVLELERQAGS